MSLPLAVATLVASVPTPESSVGDMVGVDLVHMAAEVEAMAVMAAQALVLVTILALVLVMVVQGGFMEVGQDIVAVVVTILMEGRFLSFSYRRGHSVASSSLDFVHLSTCCKRSHARRSEEPLAFLFVDEIDS